jgi:chromosome segregation ATPase
MIEPVMYFGIGFLVAALLGLLFVPLVHNRAVRLTMRRLEAATPLSIAEIRADKDQLRAEFAMSTRRLEMSVEQMKTRTTGQLAELGKKTDAINQLKKELGEKTATIFALESRDKNLRDQLLATEEEFELKSSSLREAERGLADKQADLAKLIAELGERSIMADSQRVELAALRTQVEAMKVSVADYERAVRMTEERLARERAEAEAAAKLTDEARGKLDGLAART